MKISFSSCTPHSHQNSVTAVENLRVLMNSMGINKFAGVIVPEQEY
ncbi:regulator, partial [Klebsiella michiganensis]